MGKKAKYNYNFSILMQDLEGYPDDVELIHTHEWPSDEIVELYRAGGWWKESYDAEGVLPLMKGSFDVVIAYHRLENRAVGMGRIISDGASDCYIQDLVVLPHLRGRGIGRSMVRELVELARSKGHVWIGLIAEEGSGRFYENLGFRPFPGTPMRYEPEKE